MVYELPLKGHREGARPLCLPRHIPLLRWLPRKPRRFLEQIGRVCGKFGSRRNHSYNTSALIRSRSASHAMEDLALLV
ncbi:hypothetical protein CLOM_g3062 [Closterium sp. NIES-68]|nr:hypothetical protein CLOM_g3062 [Closterium sp. NIES-68]